MQVCGFVGGLVGSRIYLPACLYPLFFPLLFFVFCFWIQTTRHWDSEDHQRRGIFEMKCVGEVVLTLFVLRI